MKVKHIKRMMCGTKGSDCSSVLAPQPALTCFEKTVHQPCSLDVTRRLDREKFRFTSDTEGISPILSFLWVLSWNQMLENRTRRETTVSCLALWLLQFTHTLRWGLSSAIPKSIINHQSYLLTLKKFSSYFQLNTTQLNVTQ